MDTIKKPEVYKPFTFLLVLLGFLELSGFAVLANYSIILVKVLSFFNFHDKQLYYSNVRFLK